MADDFKTTLAQNLTGSVPILLMLFGTAFALLGLAGGITHEQWFPIPDSIARIASGVIGLTLIGVGFLRAGSETALKPDTHSVKITSPLGGSKVTVTDVAGTIEKDLPKGYCLRIFRIYLDSNKCTPLSMAHVDTKAKTWVAHKCNIGGKPGDERAYAVFICGPSAEALVEFHNRAVDVHRKTMTDFKKQTGSDASYLPAIEQRTADMHECHRVKVTHG